MRVALRMGLLFLLLLCLLPTLSWGQDNPAPPRGRFGGGGFNGVGGFTAGGGTTGLLMNEQVRKELELVDEQIEKLQTLQRESGEKMRELFAGMRDLSEEERREKFQSIQGQMQDLTKDLQAKVDEVLLPQQRDRLKQIGLQLQMRRGGNNSADTVSEALGLTDAQRDELREREAKIAADLRAKIEAAQKDARSQLLEVLTTEQREKLEKLLGTPFELEFGQGFGGRAAGRSGPQQGGNQNQ